MRIFDMADLTSVKSDIAVRDATKGIFSYGVDGTTNYERFGLVWSGGVPYLRVSKGGSGTLRTLSIDGNGLAFQENSTTRWVLMNTVGHLVPQVNNSVDLGTTGNMPRNVYAATAMILGDGVPAPSATSGQAKIYVDTADGDLKVIFGDGVIKTIVVDV